LQAEAVPVVREANVRMSNEILKIENAQVLLLLAGRGMAATHRSIKYTRLFMV